MERAGEYLVHLVTLLAHGGHDDAEGAGETAVFVRLLAGQVQGVRGGALLPIQGRLAACRAMQLPPRLTAANLHGGDAGRLKSGSNHVSTILFFYQKRDKTLQ